MLITNCSFSNFNTSSHLISNRNGHTRPYVTSPISAKKRNLSEASSTETKNLLPLKLPSSKLLIQSAIGVFALGFIDSGYSGDWSRIGVVSRDTEDLLKSAAFLVVPFCIFLIFSLSKTDEQ